MIEYPAVCPGLVDRVLDDVKRIYKWSYFNLKIMYFYQFRLQNDGEQLSYPDYYLVIPETISTAKNERFNV